MSLSDMHFHLDGYRNHQQIYNQINSLKQYTLCVTNSSEIFQACRTTYVETKYVRFALGSHPLNSYSEFNALEFERLAKTTRYIGEVGLDFSKGSLDLHEKQKKCFYDILDILSNKNKIISVHSLRAETAVCEILSNYHSNNKIIMHWFCGDLSTMRKLADIGCYFSLNIGQLKNHLELVKEIPIERVLIESDAPMGSYVRGKYSPQKLSELYAAFSDVFPFDMAEQVQVNLKTILS